MKQPEAERLAKELTTAVRQSFEDEQVILVARWFVEDSATELCRLHEENKLLHARHSFNSAKFLRLHEANQAMLEALKELINGFGFAPAERIEKARAAIAKGEQQ